MHIYLKNNPAKFNPILIWNVATLGFFWRCSLQHEEKEESKNKTSSDMRSVPDLNNMHMKCQTEINLTTNHSDSNSSSEKNQKITVGVMQQEEQPRRM